MIVLDTVCFFVQWYITYQDHVTYQYHVIRLLVACCTDNHGWLSKLPDVLSLLLGSFLPSGSNSPFYTAHEWLRWIFLRVTFLDFWLVGKYLYNPSVLFQVHPGSVCVKSAEFSSVFAIWAVALRWTHSFGLLSGVPTSYDNYLW